MTKQSNATQRSKMASWPFMNLTFESLSSRGLTYVASYHHLLVKSALDKKMTNNKVHVIQVSEVSVRDNNEEPQDDQQVSQITGGRTSLYIALNFKLYSACRVSIGQVQYFFGEGFTFDFFLHFYSFSMEGLNLKKIVQVSCILQNTLGL